jgi:hypothetical protein
VVSSTSCNTFIYQSAKDKPVYFMMLYQLRSFINMTY